MMKASYTVDGTKKEAARRYFTDTGGQTAGQTSEAFLSSPAARSNFCWPQANRVRPTTPPGGEQEDAGGLEARAVGKR